MLVERPFEWWAQRAASEPDIPITAGRAALSAWAKRSDDTSEADDWTRLMVEVATHAAVRAALARVAAGETTAEEECLGVGRTCAEVRALAEGELRAWQQLGEDEERLSGRVARAAGSPPRRGGRGPATAGPRARGARRPMAAGILLGAASRHRATGSGASPSIEAHQNSALSPIVTPWGGAPCRRGGGLPREGSRRRACLDILAARVPTECARTSSTSQMVRAR